MTVLAMVLVMRVLAISRTVLVLAMLAKMLTMVTMVTIVTTMGAMALTMTAASVSASVLVGHHSVQVQVQVQMQMRRQRQVLAKVQWTMLRMRRMHSSTDTPLQTGALPSRMRTRVPAVTAHANFTAGLPTRLCRRLQQPAASQSSSSKGLPSWLFAAVPLEPWALKEAASEASETTQTSKPEGTLLNLSASCFLLDLHLPRHWVQLR